MDGPTIYPWIEDAIERIGGELADRSVGWDGVDADIQLEIEQELCEIIADCFARVLSQTLESE